MILYQRCLHSSYYEKVDNEVSCIDEEILYDIPDTWTWMRLENCCAKEIRRGKSPKYIEKVMFWYLPKSAIQRTMALILVWHNTLMKIP